MYEHEAEIPDFQRLRREARQPAALDPSQFTFGGHRLTPEQVVDILRPFMSPERLERIDEVAAGRTYTVTTVVEGLIDRGNVSAVMRSAEALGYQSFHLVTGGKRFKNSPRTAQGADKWLDLHFWETSQACVEHLRREGYAVVVTHLDETAVPIDAIDFTRRTALVFGNERDGVSPEMVALSDQRCVIPMTGFAQSFNISVAAAVSLYHAYRDRLAHQGFHGDLTDEERALLRAAFCLRSTKRSRQIIRDALQRI